MLGCVKWFIGTALKFYFTGAAVLIGLLALLIIPCLVGHSKSSFRYYAKCIMIYYAVTVVTLLLGPVFALRPRNVVNIQIFTWFMNKLFFVLSVTWEVRNSKLLQIKGGAMVCSNHQSSVDIWTMFNLWGIMGKVTGIAKIELQRLVPFGPCAWLAGISFVDRKSPKASYKTLSACADRMKNEDIKMFIYPEGTRNQNRGLLPFKKGAFKTAIMGQVPIIPVIMSPYYFIDGKNRTFTPGHIIVKALDPIPTTGMVDADHEALMETTRNVMLAEYEKIAAEVDKMAQNKESRWTEKICRYE